MQPILNSPPTFPGTFDSTPGNLAFRSICSDWAHSLGSQGFKEIEQKLNKLEDVQSNQSKLLLVLSKSGWHKEPFLQNHDVYPWYALRALRDGLITIEQFGTLMLYRIISMHNESINDFLMIPLWNDKGELFQKGFDTLLKTFQPVQNKLYQGSSDLPPFDTTKNHLSEDQLRKFLESLKQRPFSERCFFAFPDERIAPTKIQDVALDLINQTRTISIDIKDSVSINIFNRFEMKGSKHPQMRLVPSLGMMQAFLDAKFETPVTITPKIGLSQMESIRKNALMHTRDMALAFPGVDLPEVADNLLAPGPDFPYHDFYHALIASGVPAEHMWGSIIISDILEDLAKNPAFEQIKDIIEGFQERVLDMERPFYRQDAMFGKEYAGDLSALFWASLGFDLSSTHIRHALKKQIETKNGGARPSLEGNQAEITQTVVRLAQTTFFEKFLVEIASTKADAFDQLGINVMSIGYAASIEIEKIRQLIPRLPGAPRYAFNQEDIFEKIRPLSMFCRWNAIFEKAKKVTAKDFQEKT